MLADAETESPFLCFLDVDDVADDVDVVDIVDEVDVDLVFSPRPFDDPRPFPCSALSLATTDNSIFLVFNGVIGGMNTVCTKLPTFV